MTTSAPPPPDASAARARRKRVVKRTLGGLALGVVLVPALGIGFLHTEAGGELLRKRVVARLSERTTGTPSIDKLSFSLFSGLTVDGVVLRQANGQEAIRVGHAQVRPALWESVRGRPTLTELTVSGVRVSAKKKDSGETSLQELFKPTPAKPAEPGAKPKEPAAYVRIARLAVSDVDVRIDNESGGSIALTHVGVQGEVTAQPRTKGVALSLTEIAASVAILRPDGTRIALDDVKTSASATLTDGAGPFRLGEWTGSVALTPAGKAEVKTPLAFGAIEGTLSPGQLSLAARTISALFLSVGGITVKGATQDGVLAGPQAVTISALRVDAETLAKITGRKVLAQPLSLDLSAEGTPDALHLVGALGSAGQTLAFDGLLDARNKERLGYDLKVSTRDFAVAPLLATEAPPDVKLGALTLTAKGAGTKADTVAVDVGLAVEGLVVKGKPIDSVLLAAHLEAGKVVVKSLDVKALGQAIHAEGSYVIADKAVAFDVRTAGSVPQTLAAARKLGIPIKASPALDSLDLPEGAHVLVKGNIGGALQVTVPNVPVRVLGASARVDALVNLEPGELNAETGEKKLEAKSLDATITLAGLSPRSIAKARGKVVDVQGGLSGTVHVYGSPKAPIVDARLGGRLGAIGSDDVDVALTAHVAGGVANAKASAKTLSGDPLLTLDARVPLPGRAPAGTKVAIVLDVPRRDFDKLLPVLPPAARLKLKGVRDGFVSAHVDVNGTAQAPAGTVDVRVGGKILSDAPREARLTTTLTPAADGALGVAFGLEATGGDEGPSLSLRSDARFARSPLVDPKAALAHHTTLRFEQDLEKLPKALPLPPGLAGHVAVAADVHGTRDDVLGTVSLTTRGVRKEGSPPLDLDLTAGLGETETALTGAIALAGERLFEIGGSIALPGKGLVPALKTKEPRGLALSVKVPDRPLASLEKLAPKTKGLPGTLGGEVRITGTTAAPEANGGFAYRGYPTATGQEGRVGLELNAKAERATLDLVPGALGRVTVSLPLAAFLAARKGDTATTVPVSVTSALSGDLAAALPRLADPQAMRIAGQIQSDLGAALSLAVSSGGIVVRGVQTTGKLALASGRVELPAFARTFHGIGLTLAGDERGLALSSLAVHESDGQKADRSITGSGLVPLEVTGDKVSLGVVTAELAARDFLVSGGTFGEHDAPRASLSGGLAVRADLSGETRRIEVDAHDLVLFSPDRQPRAHAQEALSKGDVVDAKSVPVGRLGAPTSTDGKAGPSSPDSPDSGKQAGAKGLEVRVHVARTRLYQAPIDLYVEGDVLVERPAGGERALSGGLRVTGGRMLFGGKWLDVDHGELRMAAEGPILDVFFKREAPLWALRDVATEGAGHDPFVRIHLLGVVGQQQVLPVGLGDSLFEALAVLNLGQIRTITRPDLPASSAPQLPQVREIRQTSFMAANLPHLAFLDHASVTSSPSDGRFSYGRLDRLNAERYFDGGKRRWRVTTRPLVPGQSEGEVAHEWLFQNDKQTVSGIGVQAGTRLGGGPTVFWEWSSKE